MPRNDVARSRSRHGIRNVSSGFLVYQLWPTETSGAGTDSSHRSILAQTRNFSIVRPGLADKSCAFCLFGSWMSISGNRGKRQRSDAPSHCPPFLLGPEKGVGFASYESMEFRCRQSITGNQENVAPLTIIRNQESRRI